MDWRWGLMLLHEGQSGVTYDEEVPCGKTGMPRVEGHYGGCALCACVLCPHTRSHHQVTKTQTHKTETSPKISLKRSSRMRCNTNNSRPVYSKKMQRWFPNHRSVTRSNQWLTNHIWWELQRKHGNDLKIIWKCGFTFTITNVESLGKQLWWLVPGAG